MKPIRGSEPVDLRVDIKTKATAVEYDRIIEGGPVDLFKRQSERQHDDRIGIEPGCRLYRNCMWCEASWQIRDGITNQWPRLCVGQLADERRNRHTVCGRAVRGWNT